jgi:hypothetical protein
MKPVLLLRIHQFLCWVDMHPVVLAGDCNGSVSVLRTPSIPKWCCLSIVMQLISSNLVQGLHSARLSHVGDFFRASEMPALPEDLFVLRVPALYAECLLSTIVGPKHLAGVLCLGFNEFLLFGSTSN